MIGNLIYRLRLSVTDVHGNHRPKFRPVTEETGNLEHYFKLSQKIWRSEPPVFRSVTEVMDTYEDREKSVIARRMIRNTRSDPNGEVRG